MASGLIGIHGCKVSSKDKEFAELIDLRDKITKTEEQRFALGQKIEDLQADNRKLNEALASTRQELCHHRA